MSSMGQEQDPRIAALIAALRQQGHGKPLFGGHQRAQGGVGQRGLANYFHPMGAGINYNPLAAQISQGAPGLLGLNSGGDNNPNPAAPAAPAGNGPDPSASPGVAPPVQPPSWTSMGGSPPTVGAPSPAGDNPDSLGAMAGGAPYNDNGFMEWDASTSSWVPKGTSSPGNSNRPGLQGLY